MFGNSRRVASVESTLSASRFGLGELPQDLSVVRSHLTVGGATNNSSSNNSNNNNNGVARGSASPYGAVHRGHGAGVLARPHPWPKDEIQVRVVDDFVFVHTVLDQFLSITSTQTTTFVPLIFFHFLSSYRSISDVDRVQHRNSIGI